MKKFTVDRIEGTAAVLEAENGDMIDFDLKLLPENIKEGDIISFENNRCFLDKAETEARRRKIQKLMNSVFED